MMFGGCVKYDALPFEGYVLPRHSGYISGKTDDWIYYNLRTGQIFNAKSTNADIPEGEQFDRLDWDLAFCGRSLRTNSGTSGKGVGGAVDMGVGDYEKWTLKAQIPEDAQWVVDTDTVNITMSESDWQIYCEQNGMKGTPWFDPNFGLPQTKTSANALLDNALVFLAPPPTYVPSFHTYIIRAADGQTFFKLQIVSWFDQTTQIGDRGGKISFYCDKLN